MRAASPRRPGTIAEPSTPIIVARTTALHGIGVSGSAARSVWCQEIERISIASDISASDSTIQPGEAVTSAWPTRLSSRRESANATRPASRITTSHQAHASQHGAARTHRGVLGRGHLGGVYQVAPTAAEGVDAACRARCNAGASPAALAMLAIAAMRPAP